MTHGLKLGAGPLYLLLCLMLGGASAAGFWANMVLELLALPLIVWALLARRGTPMGSSGRQLLIILLLVLTVILMQLVPLPPGLWGALPGRESITNGYVLLRQPLPWLPLSLAPFATISSALWLLPAIATLLAILKLGAFKATWLAWVIVLIAAVSVALGALQIAAGEGSLWYFYRITNYGDTTGFFSNSNHLAALLVATIPFIAALYINIRKKGRSAQSASGFYTILAGALGIAAVGILINGSLAGLGLSVPVAAASLLMLRQPRGAASRGSLGVIILLLAGSVALLFNGPLGGNNLTTAEAKASPVSRYSSFRNSLEAAKDFFPAGSGVGTFVEIYPWYEEPAAISNVFMNHVHNDYIEIALEAGFLGIAVLLLFLIWWVRRVFAIWRSEEVDYFARAATIATAAILAHSCVEYPLRTAALSALFAACCALMSDARPQARRSEAAKPGKQARHLSAD